MAEFFVGLGTVILSLIATCGIIYVAFVIAGYVITIAEDFIFKLRYKK